jgi:hypothetical protein
MRDASLASFDRAHASDAARDERTCPSKSASSESMAARRDGIARGRAAAKALLVLLLTACLLAPFSNKAFHTDDPLFVWSGRSLAADPWHPYRGAVNWFGRTQPFLEAMWNPPGLPAAIAAAKTLGVESEIGLHLLMLVPALGAVAFVIAWMARSGAREPALAALLFAASPMFLVSATNVLPDLTTTASIVAALFLWTRGIDRGDRAALFAASLCCAVAMLSKYFGASILPFLAAYAIAKRASWRTWFLPLALSAVPLGAYEIGMWIETGAPALVTGARTLGGRGSVARSEVLVARIASMVAFLGAACLPMCGIAARSAAWNAKSLLAWIVAAAVISLVLARRKEGGSDSPTIVVIELALFTLNGGLVIGCLVARWRSPITPIDRWLLAWIAWECVYAAAFNWSVMGRGFLTAAALTSVLLATNSRELVFSTAIGRALAVALPVVGSLVTGTSLNAADQEIARSAKLAVEEAVAPFRKIGERVWFQGHWGFQFYAEEQGAIPMEVAKVGEAAEAVDAGATRVERGEIVVIPLLNTNVPGVPKNDYEVLEVRRYPILSPSTTLGPKSGAAFYSTNLDLLPFGVNLGDQAEYWILRHH